LLESSERIRLLGALKAAPALYVAHGQEHRKQVVVESRGARGETEKQWSLWKGWSGGKRTTVQ